MTNSKQEKDQREAWDTFAQAYTRGFLSSMRRELSTNSLAVVAATFADALLAERSMRFADLGDNRA